MENLIVNSEVLSDAVGKPTANEFLPVPQGHAGINFPHFKMKWIWHNVGHKKSQRDLSPNIAISSDIAGIKPELMPLKPNFGIRCFAIHQPTIQDFFFHDNFLLFSLWMREQKISAFILPPPRKIASFKNIFHIFPHTTKSMV